MQHEDHWVPPRKHRRRMTFTSNLPTWIARRMSRRVSGVSRRMSSSIRSLQAWQDNREKQRQSGNARRLARSNSSGRNRGGNNDNVDYAAGDDDDDADIECPACCQRIFAACGRVHDAAAAGRKRVKRRCQRLPGCGLFFGKVVSNGSTFDIPAHRRGNDAGGNGVNLQHDTTSSLHIIAETMGADETLALVRQAALYQSHTKKLFGMLVSW